MKRISAFSIIEMSIVILIIGLLIVGSSQGAKIVKQSRFTVAQSLTKSSPAAHTPDLVLWYETALESSFLTSEAVDGSNISVWRDNNRASAITKDATQTTVAYQPKFYVDIFANILPAVRFDGVNDYLDFDGLELLNTSYTVFIVEQRRSSGGWMALIGGTSNTPDADLQITYKNTSTLTMTQLNGELNYTLSAYSAPVQRFHTFLLNSSVGRKYWLNGGTAVDASDSNTGVLSAYAGSAVGKAISGYFNGDIAEIIIFKRALRTEERQLIEDYLIKKYRIKIS